MVKDLENFSINSTLKRKLPKGSFLNMKDFYLGKKYDLSLVFCGKKKSKSLNQKWRDKNYAANILSFPISEDMGEIYIDLDTAKKEHGKFDRDFENYISFLFIHGLVHLNQYDHGVKMEQQEQKVRKKFNI